MGFASKVKGIANFYPRPPRGGRRWQYLDGDTWIVISIHALREEGDAGRGVPAGNGPISIHALREEGDSFHCPCFLRPEHFYPRPPRGGRRNHR